MYTYTVHCTLYTIKYVGTGIRIFMSLMKITLFITFTMIKAQPLAMTDWLTEWINEWMF